MVRVYQRPDSKYWYAEIKTGTGTKRVSTGIPAGSRNKRSAEEAGYKLQTELSSKELGGISLEDAIVQYMELAPIRESTKDVYNTYLARILASHPEITLGEITPVFCRTLIADMKKEGMSKPTLRILMAALSSVLEMAADERWEGAPEVNPVRLISRKSIRKEADPDAQPRWIPLADMAKILSATQGSLMHSIFVVLLETGMRKQEVVKLTWEEVNLRDRCIFLPGSRTKSGKPRVIPLTNTALHTIKAQARLNSSSFVFINKRTRKPYTSIDWAWRRLRVKLGMPSVRIHDIRHTFATWTRGQGLNKDDRMEIMGHADEGVHDLYAKSEIRALVERLEGVSPSTLLAQFHLTPRRGVIEKDEKVPNIKTLGVVGSSGRQDLTLTPHQTGFARKRR